jgi:hypothetical protein
MGWAAELRVGRLAGLMLPLLLCGMGAMQGQSAYTITSATDGTSATIPAGANGAVLNLAGTLPSAQQIGNGTVLGCFYYSGNGSSSALPLTAPAGSVPEQLSVPASSIQGIPQSSFTAANGYSVTALVYFADPDAGLCNGYNNSQLSNAYPVQIVAPSLGAYAGPTSIPQTNPATKIQAAPVALVLPAAGFLTTASGLGTTSITFGSFGAVNLTIPATATSAVYVPVPAAFSSSPAGTTASLSICNTLTGVSAPVCTTPTPAITLTVAALTASAGTLTASPTPVQLPGQTVLTAQFAKAAGATGDAGAPSGTVSFAADGATVAPAGLILDKTATFATQTTAISPPAAPTPAITPTPGAYTGAQTVTITDALANAAIYYTLDGTTPTASSTLYSGPFSITSSETVSAIAVAAGFLNSAVASAAYTITILPATQLAFVMQPSNEVLNTAIAPPVQVALKDVNGTVVVNSTAAVTVSLYSNPGDTTLGGTATQNAVNGIATFPDLTVGNLGTGYSLQAQSYGLIPATSQPFNVTPPAITMTVQSDLVGIGSTLTGGFTLGAPAPAGGLVVTLTSGTPANVTIAPASVTVAAGQTTGSFTYTGVAAGNAILSAAANNYTTGTVMTTGTAAQVSLGTIPNVAPAQMQSIALSLATPAPAGGTTVTFTIANPNIATVTASSFIPAGLQTPAANPQVTGVLIGNTTVTANAPGYAPATRPVVVTVTASFNPQTTNINLATATNTSLTISAPAPPGGITFTLSSDAPTIASVPASVTVPAGATSVPIAITGVSSGNTTIRADSAGITEATGTVNVYSNIGTSNFTTGYDLETDTGLYLPVAPSAPTTVTMTVADPTVAVISTSNTTVGQATLTFPNTTSSYITTLWIQGLKVGTTTISILAPGYTAGTVNVTVTQSGFAFYYYSTSFTTTTYSSPTAQTIYPTALDGNLAPLSYGWYINPQSAPISLPLSSSSPSVGTVPGTVVFKANDSYENFNFQPVSAGTTNIDIGTPPTGFSVPSQNQQDVATVNTPAIAEGNVTTGVNLQASANLYLPEPPPSAVTVTVSSVTPGAATPSATLSKSATVAGAATQTFTVAAGNTFIGTVYFQGQTVGTSTLTVAAPGYTSSSNTITVLQSGFTYYYGYSANFSTTTFSQPSSLTVYTAALNSNLQVQSLQLPLNPGVGPVTLPILDSAASVGTISPASLVFNTGDTQQSFSFTPVSAGTTNLTIGTPPTGFATPSQYQQSTATVTAPAMNSYSPYTGVSLENNFFLSIPQSTPTPETVTVTSSNAAVATLSTTETTAGTGTLTFTTTNGSGQNIWVQGQSAGTATITISAPGFTPSTGTITVYPSGFVQYYGAPPFTTTTFSSPNTINVYTATLNTNLGLQNLNLPLNPGITATVVVTDSAPSVGTISPAALVFANNDSTHSYTFQPVSAGTTNLSISTPAGFSTPSNYQTGTATVTAPVIQVNNVTSAVNLQQSLSIYLPQTPPNPVTVTVTSSSPTLAKISTDPTVVGTSTVVFTNVTSTNVGTIYVQGQALGTAALTETAPGYTNGSSTITVQPGGFAFYYNNETFSTTVANGPYTLTAYPFALNSGTNTLIYYPLMVNPGLGSITVPVASSNPAVGTVPSGPSFAPGGSSADFNFVPHGTGTATVTLGTPTGFTTPSQAVTATGTVQ